VLLVRARRAAVLLLLTALACTKEPPPEAAAPAPPARPVDQPLLARSTVRVTERFRLSGAALEQARLEQPRDLDLDDEGKLYVLDIGEPIQLLKFGVDGRFELRFDEGEESDSSIASALEIDVAPWRTILLVDRGRNALSTYLTLGFHATTVELQGTGIDALALPGFNEYYLHKWVPERRRVQIVHMRAPLDSLHATYTVFIPPDRSVRQEARDVFLRTAVDGAGQLYVGFHDGYPVRVLTPEGKTVRLIDLDRAPIRKLAAAIAEERERNLARLRAGAPDVADSLLRQAAEPDTVAPMIEELSVDPRGRLWVRTNRPDANGATPYDVFNERGEYFARVDIPGNVLHSAFGPDGWIYVIDATSEASPTIVGYEVSFEDGPAATGG
jgi:hypothetical protein